MLTFNPTLRDALLAATSKLQWSTVLKTALGNTRRVRAKRDNTLGAPDVWVTGTEFLNMDASGAIIVQGGAISNLGKLAGATISTNANLTTGECVLRIEGNGNYVQGTLGLSRDAQLAAGVPANALVTYDFVMKKHYVGSQGLAFTPTSVKPPKLLASGTGYTAPAKDLNGPAYVTIESWVDPLNPVVVGTITFNKRVEDIVFEDAEVAAEIGDIRLTESTTSVTLGGHEFGAMLMSMNPLLNSTPGEVLHQVLIGFKPTAANWPGYPAYSTYSATVTDTFMSSFKAHIYRADGVKLYTHEMRDGLPFNSDQYGLDYTQSRPSRAWLHCGHMLPWQSRKPKLSSKAAKYFAGMEPDVMRPTLTRFKTSYNMAYVPIGGSYNVNALGHWFGTPKWAQAPDSLIFANSDPYLWPVGGEYAPYGNATAGINLALGWGYEPGSPALHDHYTGPGGSRSDRSIMPQTLAAYFTDPTYVRPYGNESIEELADNWNMAYFNHPCHYLTDVKTFATIPNAQILSGEWSFGGGTYYGGNSSYTSGGMARTVPMFALGASGGTNQTYRDKNGRWPWNGSGIDFLHNYTTPGWTAIMFNSPMHAYATKLRMNAGIMCQLGHTGTGGFWTGVFMTRQHSWRMLQSTMAWKMGSKNPMLISRGEMEARIQAELEAIYDEIVLPAQNPAPGDAGEFFRAFNNLGCWTSLDYTFYTQSPIATTATGPSETLQMGLDDYANKNYIHHSSNPIYGRYVDASPVNPVLITIAPAGTSDDARAALPHHEIIGFNVANNTLQLRNAIPASLNQAGYVIKHPRTVTRRIGSAGQMFYMGHALQLMRQVGLFSVLRNKNAKCSAALMYMIKCLDKFSIDWVLDADGVAQYYYPIGTTVLETDPVGSVVATSWANHAATYSAKTGVEDFTRTPAGNRKDLDDLNEHNRSQWVFIRRDYFPEIPCERGPNGIADACAKFRFFYDRHNTDFAVVFNNPAKTAFDKRAADWGYRMPQLGFIKPPTQLGDY